MYNIDLMGFYLQLLVGQPVLLTFEYQYRYLHRLRVADGMNKNYELFTDMLGHPEGRGRATPIWEKIKVAKKVD